MGQKLATNTLTRLGLATAVTLLLGTSGPLQAQSLTDTLINAYRNSNLLEQNRALLRAADEDTALALSGIRPVIDYVLQFNESNANDLSEFGQDSAQTSVLLQLSTDIYTFGRNRLSEAAARYAVLAARDGLKQVENEVFLDAINAFFDVRQATTVVALRIGNLSLIERELQASRDRFEVGEVTRTDVAIAESRLAQAQADLAAANGALDNTRELYRLTVGQYPTTLSSPGAVPQVPSSLDAARNTARQRNPEILQAQHNVTVAELNAENAERAIYPTLSGTAQVGVDDDGDSQNNVGVTLRGPIYRGGSISATFRQTLADLDATKSGLLQTSLRIDQNVGVAWSDLNSATARISATAEQVRAQQLAFDGLREEAALGARTTLEVLDAEQDLLDAQTDQSEAINDRYVEAYTVLSTMGLLTVEDLGLGIATYDPEAYYNAVRNAPATSTRGRRLDRVLKSIGRE
ncbi:MAG: TolC family outer membrane protein [Pseudomonadota bacterium]